jgi:hypothetical protein
MGSLAAVRRNTIGLGTEMDQQLEKKSTPPGVYSKIAGPDGRLVA